MEMTWDIGIGEGYSTEYCLMVMLEKCKKALDKRIKHRILFNGNDMGHWNRRRI